MLPNEGKEGERASCDWISFKLTLLMPADVETCTVNIFNLLRIGSLCKNFRGSCMNNRIVHVKKVHSGELGPKRTAMF